MLVTALALMRTELASSLSQTTPMPLRSLPIVRTSARSGTLCRMTSSVVSKPAAIMGSAAFLAPEARTSPTRRRPPLIFSFCMVVVVWRICQSFCCHVLNEHNHRNASRAFKPAAAYCIPLTRPLALALRICNHIKRALAPSRRLPKPHKMVNRPMTASHIKRRTRSDCLRNVFFGHFCSQLKVVGLCQTCCEGR